MDIEKNLTLMKPSIFLNLEDEVVQKKVIPQFDGTLFI